MNLRELKYLVALYEHRHFGQAAQACFVSQPTLSMQIKKLEEELGVVLLERGTRNNYMTSTGTQIALLAQRILAQVEEIKKIAQEATDPLGGELRIGIIPTLAPYFLPKTIPLLKKAFPKIKFILVEEKTPQLIQQLQQGKLDTALLALPIIQEDLASISLFEEPFLLAVPKTHILAKYKTVNFRHLENQAILLLEEGHCLRDQTLNFCERLHTFSIENVFATSLETLRYMVAFGAGITFIPQLAYRKEKDIVYIPFQSPSPSRHIGLVYRRGFPRLSLLNLLTKPLTTII